MVRTGKLVRRNRLIKWGLPYIRDGIRRGKCEGRCLDDQDMQGCVICQANANLTEWEWNTITYYYKVRHSYRNQTPNGCNGPPVLTPVFADWEAVLRIQGYPQSEWAQLVELAEMLFYVVTDQIKPEVVTGPYEIADFPEWFASRYPQVLEVTEALITAWQT